MIAQAPVADFDLAVIGGGVNGAGIARDAAGRGLKVLLVEQNARQALAIADMAYVMEIGRIVLTGPARELASDPRVQTAYLGGSSSEFKMQN